ncbi:MAG: hypothetical protein IRY84_14660 [Thermobispora bispora]|nr:hypothetical protein [Thermobispora bispora]
MTVQDDRYEYDISGEITKILDAAAASGGSPGQSECFTYDGLHRLSQAWTTTASACGTSTASADNQGIDPYAQSFAYDGVGNLTSLISNGQAAIYDYPQPGTDAVRPNAVTSISRPTGTDTYAYDDAGQMTSRTVGGKAGTFTWNELGQLEKATIDGQDTTMVYDADGERLIRHDPGGKATLYLGSMDIEVNGSAITGKRYYTTPDGATVAMRIGGDGVTWLMSGLHGSTQLAVDDTTGKVSRERYLPFGQRRGDDDLPFTDHGFLGKVEDDSTGLDYLSARYYDPFLTKFVSTDPMLDPSKPRIANPYGYAGDNPIGMSDPTGLSPDPPGGRLDACKNWNSKQCKDLRKLEEYYQKIAGWCRASRANMQKQECKIANAVVGSKKGPGGFQMAFKALLGVLPTPSLIKLLATIPDDASLEDVSKRVISWAKKNHGKCEKIYGMMTCYGLSKDLVSRGGQTIGDVFVTWRDKSYLLDHPELLKHEAVHREQWHRYAKRDGYWYSFAIAYLLAGISACGNKFEQEAGLKDGGYLCVPSPTPGPSPTPPAR